MEKKEFTITIYTENSIGIIGKISNIFSRRKLNIESLNASPSEVENIHRFTLVLNENQEVIEKLCKQIEKQIDVLKVYFNTSDEIIWQEQALFKVPTQTIIEKASVERLFRQYGANAVVIRQDFTVFETSGHREEINALTEALTPYNLIEFVRSGRIAIIKESKGFHTKLKEFERQAPGKAPIENEYLEKRQDIFTI